jgi:hypothetical protein
MRRTMLVAALAGAALLAGCNKGSDPYRQAGNPPGQNPQGTPADRTGGATAKPDGVGGGPGTQAGPANRK